MRRFAFALLALASVSPARAEEAVPLSFAQVVSMAAQQNASVQVAQLRTAQAAAKVTQSRGALLPSVSGQASMTDRTFNLYALGITLPSAPGAAPYPALQGPVWDSEARLRVSQPVFDWSAWRKLRASRLGLVGARADQGVSGEAAAANAALAYLRAARAEAVVTARAEDLRLAEELQSLAEAQLAAGTAPQIDVTRARTQVAATRGALSVAHNQRDRARIDLSRAIGLPPSTSIALADTLDSGLGASEAPAEGAAAVAFALDHRDDLRAEQARLQRARADRSATSAERLPRVDASLDWGLSGEHYGDAIQTRTWAVAVTVPLVDGFRREGKLAEQAGLVRESEVREKDVRSQVEAEITGALLDLSSGQDQQQVAAMRLQLAHDEVAQARERFVSGVAGNIEVINAQSSLVRARDADIDARFAIASARTALARAAGVARRMH
ncbi:MAG: TolC family protein [Candidatus Eisenbacteria bacterium]|nr:TolC family protein [Candidatus Eisenbacteria bacterium]